jgi:hypothetical protein
MEFLTLHLSTPDQDLAELSASYWSSWISGGSSPSLCEKMNEME